MQVINDITKTGAKKKVTLSNRYATAMPTESIAEVKEEVTKRKEEVTQRKKDNLNEVRKLEILNKL